VSYNRLPVGTAKPTKKSVALAIFKEDEPSRVLLVCRPTDDVEFPGMWGLPAASLHGSETYQKSALRIGAQKLGTQVRVGKSIGSGSQDRRDYTLEMYLYGASLDGALPVLPCATEKSPGITPRIPPRITPRVTMYVSWRWGILGELEESARRGSLCSQLLLEASGLS